MTIEPMRILFAVSEAFPLIKVGGLADVAYALPKALARRGHRVQLVLPGYDELPPGRRIGNVTARLSGERHEFEIVDVGSFNGVQYLALRDKKTSWGRPEGYVEKDLAAFILFSRAVAAVAMESDYRPDIVHCNDWHVAHCPAYLRAVSAGKPGCGSVLTIHNLAYQGRFSPTQFDGEPALVSEDRKGNLLAQGIRHADAVTTVSRRYRDEILTRRYGMELDDLLRARAADFHGILNGVDHEAFNPKTDRGLVANFDVDHMGGKAINKKTFQARYGLPDDADVPLVVFVARLVRHKGIELLLKALDRIMEMDLQLVIVGTGAQYERLITRAGRRCAKLVHLATSDEQVARLAYAAGDIFLAPSEYEPCGLAPLIALRYGAVPVVRRTGGLAETVGRSDNASPELGFGFNEDSVAEFCGTLATAIQWYREPEKWAMLRLRGMSADFSWAQAAERYEQLYHRTVGR